VQDTREALRDGEVRRRLTMKVLRDYRPTPDQWQWIEIFAAAVGFLLYMLVQNLRGDFYLRWLELLK